MAKYGKSASKNVKSTMRRRKKGTLKRFGTKGEESQAGDRDRSQRGAGAGRKGTA